MAQIFGPSANTLATLSLWVGAALPVAILVGGSQITRSPYNTNVDVAVAQPVPFSHQHHVKELGIDCRFCHHTVEKSAIASVPATDVCMTCHSQIWTNSPMLEPVRTSYETGTPIEWNRVNSVPEFVYFDHSIHIDRGISCNNCHGDIQNMQITSKGRAFAMAWCLQCHKDPAEYMYSDPTHSTLSPREQIFEMYRKIQRGEDLTPVEKRLARGMTQLVPNAQYEDSSASEIGEMLVEQMHVNTTQMADCWICHR